MVCGNPGTDWAGGLPRHPNPHRAGADGRRRGHPALVAAVGDAGGFGFLPSGYLGVGRLHKDMDAVRALTHADFGVNVFVPQPPTPGVCSGRSATSSSSPAGP